MKSTLGTRAFGSMTMRGATLAARRRLIGPVEARIARATRAQAPTVVGPGRIHELAV
jgi:hypothetical protein